MSWDGNIKYSRRHCIDVLFPNSKLGQVVSFASVILEPFSYANIRVLPTEGLRPRKYDVKISNDVSTRYPLMKLYGNGRKLDPQAVASIGLRNNDPEPIAITQGEILGEVFPVRTVNGITAFAIDDNDDERNDQAGHFFSLFNFTASGKEEEVMEDESDSGYPSSVKV